MEMLHEPEFWEAVGFVLVIAVLLWKGVPGRVGSLGDIALVLLPVAAIILRPPASEDDWQTHQMLIAYGILDWIVEGNATADPEVLVPLAVDLARHSRHAREVVDGLATQA